MNPQTEHVEGPPWQTVGRYTTYEQADSKRQELVIEENVQVKIHYQGTRNNRHFSVKTRHDPDVIDLINKREEKRRRKKKLSKKRRKK